MQHLLDVNWSWSSRVLSGNHGVETLIAHCPLPEDVYWLIISHRNGYSFAGNKRVVLRKSGKGQVTVMGEAGVSCELTRGRNSAGDKVEFISVISMFARGGKRDTLSLPYPIRRETLEQDLEIYRAANLKTPDQWAKRFGWTKGMGCGPRQYAAADNLCRMLATTDHEERLRQFSMMANLVTMEPEDGLPVFE